MHISMEGLLAWLVLVTLQGSLSIPVTKWIGKSGQWTDASNWDTGQVPSAFDSVILESGKF